MSAVADRTINAATPVARVRATARSEWIKLVSVRSGPVVVLAGTLVMLAGSWLVSSSYRGNWAFLAPADRAAFDATDITLRGIDLAQLLVGTLGVLTVTGEYSSGLIRQTLTATPQRGQLLAVKAAVFTAVVWAWCTALCVLAVLLGQRFLNAPVPQVSLTDPTVLRAVLGGGVYLTLVGSCGLFLGAVVRRTAAALAVLFGLLLVLPLVATLIGGDLGDRITEITPSGAGGQIWKTVHAGPHTLGPWQGVALFAGYATVVAVASFALIRRRDV